MPVLYLRFCLLGSSLQGKCPYSMRAVFMKSFLNNGLCDVDLHGPELNS